MIEMFGNEAVVYAPTELSWVNAREFCQSLARALALAPESLVIDLAYVEFCDDTGVTLLAQALHASDTVPLHIRNVTAAVRAAEDEVGVQLPRPRGNVEDPSLWFGVSAP